MREQVVITPARRWTADGDPEPGVGEAYSAAVLYIAPLQLRRPQLETGREEERAGFQVGLSDKCPISDGDLIEVRGLACKARVEQWRSPFTGRGALVVEAISERG